MHDVRQSKPARPLLYVIGSLVLLIFIMFFWKGCAVRSVEKRVEDERAELASQQEQLEQRLREETDRRIEEVLRLMAVPLGWAVRTEAIGDDYDQIEDYANHLLKQPRVQRVVLVTPEGIVRMSTDRKLQGQPAAEIFGDLGTQQEITLRKDDSGDYQLMVPILGYNERLGSLIVAIEAD
jgi:hypothetical protein